MNRTATSKLFLFLSLPLASLIIISSAVGLLYPDFYTGATASWKMQTLGQDGIDLFLIVPVLVVSAFYSDPDRQLALSVWGGTNIYIVYTFAIYCFDVRFNSLFVIYCLILGLSFYSAGVFFYRMVKDDYTVQATSVVRRLVGYFFILLSGVFYFTWLSDILPAIVQGRVPAGVAETGLLTNPVHVIDLAVILPLMMVVGVFMLKANSLAIAMATPLLIFTILMDVTIATLAVLLFWAGASDSYMVAIVMGVHAALGFVASYMLWNKIEFMKPARQWNLN